MAVFYAKFAIFFVVCTFGRSGLVHGGFNDYIKDIREYFGYSGTKHIKEDFTHNIPYEVSSLDEKFISEAAKLTGVALSQLDSCQQRVILKLKTDCHKLNDEQLAKLAVHLLNCQSYIEGRRTFPCTDDMSIKDCTTEMDSDIWTIYHLMSNRARAVCYMIRQTQFRGLAESTVNRLMDATMYQIQTLDKISISQENLQDIAHQTYDSIAKGHDVLLEQQKNIQRANLYGQLSIENNIARLVDEKRIIAETHNKLLSLTNNLQEKLQESNNQVKIHEEESKLNHQELIRDLIAIQEQTKHIFEKMEESSQLLIIQSREFKNHYEYTLRNLKEVNKTVHTLVSLVKGTRETLEDRLEWVSNALGGTDLVVERLYLILWQVTFLLFGMLACAFLGVGTSTKVIVILLPSLNLALGMYEKQQHLSPLDLLVCLIFFILFQGLISCIIRYQKIRKGKSLMLKEKDPSSRSNSCMVQNENKFDCEDSHSSHNSLYPDITPCEDFTVPLRKFTHEYNDFGSPTPPLSRSGFYRSRSRSKTPNLVGGKTYCHAKTRLGTPCKLSSMTGRDYCYKHLSGDSVYNG
ncbi:hypothetical protein WA026_008039 [Henosepilachna vigintioctopunctata]|uniref:Protein brambleberry n=1 Tax=Henosepilachna vigintioctopunctata TaxID=420089 RepID=A0AAW1TRT7_9CUCU